MATDPKGEAQIRKQAEGDTSSSPNLAADFLFTIFLGILVLVFFIEALDYVLMSAIAPFIVMIPLMVLLLIHAIRLMKQVKWNAVTQFTKTVVTVKDESYKKIGIVMVWAAVLIVLVYLAGYYVGSVVYLFLMLRIIAKESWAITVFVMTLIPLSLYVILEIILGQQLYRGIIYMIWQGYSIF